MSRGVARELDHARRLVRSLEDDLAKLRSDMATVEAHRARLLQELKEIGEVPRLNEQLRWMAKKCHQGLTKISRARRRRSDWQAFAKRLQGIAAETLQADLPRRLRGQ
jgi:chromosome segregation ATPase